MPTNKVKSINQILVQNNSFLYKGGLLILLFFTSCLKQYSTEEVNLMGKFYLSFQSHKPQFQPQHLIKNGEISYTPPVHRYVVSFLFWSRKEKTFVFS